MVMIKIKTTLAILITLISLGFNPAITSASGDLTAHNRTLKSASELDYPPFALVRPDGSADGFSVELLRAVAREIGMAVDFTIGPWPEIKQQLAEGSIEVLPLVAQSKERDKIFDFSVPYLQMHGAIFVRKDDTSIRRESDLKGKEVMVMRGDSAHEYAVSRKLSEKLILTESYTEAFTLLAAGKHDAVLSQYLMGLQLLGKLGITNVISPSSQNIRSLKLSGREATGFEQKFCFAVKKGDKDLLSHLNEGLAIVYANGTYENLYQKWFGPILPDAPFPYKLVLKYVLLFLLPLIIVILLVAYFYLRQEVAIKTASLQKAQKFNETILNESPDVIYVYDLVSRKNVYSNQGIEKVLGYSVAEIREMGAAVVKKLMHPDDFRSYLEKIVPQYQSLGDHEIIAHEYRMQSKSGQWHWLSSRESVFLRDEDRATRQIFGILSDITQQKAAEEKVLKSESEYRALFNRMSDGFALHEIIVDEAGVPVDYRFLKINPSFERLTGLQAANLIGKTVREVMPETEQHWIDTYGKVALTGEATSFENYSAILDRHFAVTAYQPAPHQFACIFQDITSRKKGEEERRELELQLRQIHKMEAVGTMAGGIAHDFNNILAIILGNAELAAEDIPADNPAGHNINEIIAASARAKKLVRQILAFSRKEKAELDTISPQPLIKETLQLLRATTPSTISIIQEISPDCGAIRADPTQLHQLLMNLFVNGVDAMNEKGEISVRLEEVDLNRGDLAEFTQAGALLAGKVPGKYACLSVADSGSGIEQKIIERIFDPFFTTKGVGKGTGMGLSVVHGIVSSHGGFVDVASEVGKGTTFRVFLPITAAVESPEVADPTTHATGTERILLVDDEEDILAMATKMIQSLGYDVTAESRSQNALDLFQADPGRFDLIITDQTMPGLSGTELVREVRQVRQDIPIILCTGYSSKVSAENAKEQGISRYINKPFRKNSLAEAIRNVLDSKE